MSAQEALPFPKNLTFPISHPNNQYGNKGAIEALPQHYMQQSHKVAFFVIELTTFPRTVLNGQ